MPLDTPGATACIEGGPTLPGPTTVQTFSGVESLADQVEDEISP